MRGDISSSGTLRIDGRLEGNILSAVMVVVGAGASITGNVAAREMMIGGSVDGHIVAETRVELEASAMVSGDIEADSILVHEGATINGSLRMRRHAADRPKALPAVSAGGDGSAARPTPRAPHLAVASRES